MKKVILLGVVMLASLVIAITFKYPPIEAKQPSTLKVEKDEPKEINLDSIDNDYFKQVSKIKDERKQIETANIHLEKSITVLKKQVNTLSTELKAVKTKEIKPIIDTVYVQVHDTTKGDSFKTNIFGKKKKIN